MSVVHVWELNGMLAQDSVWLCFTRAGASKKKRDKKVKTTKGLNL